MKLLAESPGDICSKLLVDIVESWIKMMSDTFPKTAAGLQNMQIDFDRSRELKLQSFVTEFIEEYDASGLSHVISNIGFGHIGRFLNQIFFWRGHILCATTRNPLSNFRLIVSSGSTPALSYITLPAGRCIVPHRH